MPLLTLQFVNWMVNITGGLSFDSRGGGDRSGRDRRGGGFDLKCYECGEPDHVARECQLQIDSGGLGSARVIAVV